jgi:hypothetical protein
MSSTERRSRSLLASSSVNVEVLTNRDPEINSLTVNTGPAAAAELVGRLAEVWSFRDHGHRRSPDVPVFAAPGAVIMVRRLRVFEIIIAGQA